MSPELRAAIVAAVNDMRSIPYFPQEAEVHKSIMKAVSRFAASVEGVKWMAQQAIDHMGQWTGIPELRGIYCAGGFPPLDGRHASTKFSALTTSQPAYYLPAPVMQKQLAAPEDDPAVEAELQAQMKELQAQIDRKKARRLAFEAQYVAPPAPDWLRSLDPGPKPN